MRLAEDSRAAGIKLVCIYMYYTRRSERERAKEFNANASRDVELFVRLRVANGEARRDGVCAVFSRDEKKMFVQGERTLLWIGANDFFPLFQLVVGVYSVLLWGL